MKILKNRKRRGIGEASFSLIETVIALGIITFLIIEVSAVQGNSIVFSEYGRNVTQATWLARRVMAQVEYFWGVKPFKELQQEVKETKFSDFDEYSYALDIKEWKFPFVELLTGGKGDKDKDEGGGEDKKDGGLASMIEPLVKQIFGDEPQFLTAHVEVSWAEGASRNSVGMTYLLTNQKKLDEALVALKPDYDKAVKAAGAQGNTNKPVTTPPPGPGGGNGGGGATF